LAGVSTPPGKSALTRTFFVPSSAASTCTSPVSPALLAA